MASLTIASPSVRVKQVLDLCKLSTILLTSQAPADPDERKSEIRRFYVSLRSIRDAGMFPAKAVDLRAYRRSRIIEVVQLRSKRLSIAKVSSINVRPRSGGFRERLRRCAVAVWGIPCRQADPRLILPTDGTNVPDFMVCSGDLVPEVNVLYGLRCEGGFTHLLRFEAANADGPIGFSDLAATALDVSGAPVIGMVMGGRIRWASWRRSSSLAGNGASCEHLTVPISRGAHLVIVLHGAALFAVTGVDLRVAAGFPPASG